MASLEHADLPSSDEEDDDYDPSADPTGEKEDRPGAGAGAAAGGSGGGQHKGSKRRRAAAAGGAAADHDVPRRQQAAAAHSDDEEPELTPAQAAKKARVSAIFEELAAASTGSANKLSRNAISLASLCSNTDPKKKRNTDALWMRNLGITPHSKRASGASLASTPGSTAAAAAAGGGTPAADGSGEAGAGAAAGGGDAGPSSISGNQQQGGASQAARAAAAAALAAAKEGAAGGVGRSYNKVTLTETRRFAGKDIEVTVEVDKDSKAAKQAAARTSTASTGLDAFLKNIEQKKKVTVLDKTKMDWQGFKATDKNVQEELAAHARSDKQYLDKQEFLQRAELREYEIERDKRLQSDVRLRGRL